MAENKSQSGEGYICICGQKFSNLKEFRAHLLSGGRNEPGQHRSNGRVNMQTGEITMPPWNQRTKEQKNQSSISKKKDNPTGAKTAGRPTQQSTEILANATQIQFIPRIYTVDYSPIMRAAQEAAIRLWHWNPAMPFGDFLDTCLYLLFKIYGVTLTGYSIDETEEERKEREKV